MDKKDLKTIEDIIDKKLKDFKRKEVNNFRKWNRFASATDVYSPITGASSQIAFYGAPKIAQPTVSGSKGGNTALASLITALSSGKLNLIKDSTT